MMQITNPKTLNNLAKAGFIKWPVLVNWPENKKPYPKYVDEVEEIGSSFEYNKTQYRLKYVSGCFFPYLYTL